jgi:hypothetical protein
MGIYRDIFKIFAIDLLLFSPKYMCDTGKTFQHFTQMSEFVKGIPDIQNPLSLNLS